MNKYQQVTKKLVDSGMGKLLSEVSLNSQISNEEQLSEIPIPSTMIHDNEQTQIWFDEQVLEEYQNMLQQINNEETAKEYPFVLLGHNTQIDDKDVIFFDQLVYCYDERQQLDGKVVSFDISILEQLIDDKTHDVISIGHTHPLLKDKEIEDKMATSLSDEVKNRFDIRRPGLNVSLQDFYQFDELEKQILDKKLLQCVIDHDGEIIMINNNGQEYEKFVDIIGFKDDKEIKLHTRSYVGEKNIEKDKLYNDEIKNTEQLNIEDREER